MSKLYPLLMTPRFDPRPWGTHDLSPIYAKQFAEKIGESWLTGDECKVQNGPLARRSLGDLAAEYGRELVGGAAREERRFPLLAKFLFPCEKLSVQVHPDDAAAQASGEPWGKTECWYVAYARPGAQVGLGLKPGVTREQLRQAIIETRAEELLNWIDVNQGEMVYVDGGTVHTIGPGAILIEIQQSSDITYRMYDYGRPRQLHIEEALAVTKERTRAGKVVIDGNKPEILICSPCFRVEKIAISGTREYHHQEMNVLIGFRGSARVVGPNADPVSFSCGDAVVIPASLREFKIAASDECEFLRATLPGGGTPEPKTILASSQPSLGFRS